MTTALYSQLVSLTTGLLLLTSVLLVWRQDPRAGVRWLALQGVSLAALVSVLALEQRLLDLVVLALLVLALKGILLPILLTRGVRRSLAGGEETPRRRQVGPLIAVVVLTSLAYLVSEPLVALGDGAPARAVPIGVAMVLLGFLILITRRRAAAQLVGFLVLDNGIATVALLTAQGVPLVVELGVSLDVLLVVIVLNVLARRMRGTHGGTDLDELTELRD